VKSAKGSWKESESGICMGGGAWANHSQRCSKMRGEPLRGDFGRWGAFRCKRIGKGQIVVTLG